MKIAITRHVKSCFYFLVPYAKENMACQSSLLLPNIFEKVRENDPIALKIFHNITVTELSKLPSSKLKWTSFLE